MATEQDCNDCLPSRELHLGSWCVQRLLQIRNVPRSRDPVTKHGHGVKVRCGESDWYSGVASAVTTTHLSKESRSSHQMLLVQLPDGALCLLVRTVLYDSVEMGDGDDSIKRSSAKEEARHASSGATHPQPFDIPLGS